MVINRKLSIHPAIWLRRVASNMGMAVTPRQLNDVADDYEKLQAENAELRAENKKLKELSDENGA